MLDADFSDLTLPAQTRCRNHCGLYFLFTGLAGDSRADILKAAIKSDVPTADMSARFREKQVPINRSTLERHRKDECECCRRHGTLT